MAHRVPGRHRGPQGRQAGARPEDYGHAPLESEIQLAIRRQLERLSFSVSVYSEPRRTHLEPGHPDLRVRHGAWRLRCFIETKSSSGRLSAEQREWHATERESGGVVLVVRSVEDCLAQINALRRRAA